MNKFHQRCKETAKRFLRTVVVVDDEAYSESVRPPGSLEKPTRRTLRSGSSAIATKSPTSASGETEENAGKVGSYDRTHSLDTEILIESFSRQGLICAVVAPRSGANSSDIVDLVCWRTNRLKNI